MNNHIQMPPQMSDQNTTGTKRWWRSYYVCKESWKDAPYFECNPSTSPDDSEDPTLTTISVCRFLAEETKQRIVKEKYTPLFRRELIQKELYLKELEIRQLKESIKNSTK
jgi:hypothetical protein